MLVSQNGATMFDKPVMKTINRPGVLQFIKIICSRRYFFQKSVTLYCKVLLHNMDSLSKLKQFYIEARHNRWFNYFTVFCRVALAAGFIPSGFVKVNGERFTALSNNQPMGHYLEALFHTGYYYTFIGIAQITAALLLLIPRTAVLGALLYFPIILNICILSLSIRFDGSLLSSPLMVLANLYLLCWHYDKIQYIFPFKHRVIVEDIKPAERSKKFPWKFAVASFATVIALVLIIATAFNMKPYNDMLSCLSQCKDSKNPDACKAFCSAIHEKGEPLDKSLDAYDKAVKKAGKN